MIGTRLRRDLVRGRGPAPGNRYASWIVLIGLVLAALLPPSVPLRAAPDAGVGATTAQQADAETAQADAARSLAYQGADAGQRWDVEAGQWRWRIEALPWLGAWTLGFLAAFVLLWALLATAPKPVLAPRRGFDWKVIRSLDADLLLFGYLLAAAGCAVFAYSAAFQWLSTQAESVSKLGTWGPTGLITALTGVLFTKATRRKILIARFAGEGNGSFLGLMRIRMDDDVQERIAALAKDYEVGLIQRTVWAMMEDSVDQARLEPAARDEFMTKLLELKPGEDEPSAFRQSQRALHRATEMVTIEDLQARLPKQEWRTFRERRTSTNGRKGPDRRTVKDRRKRSVWKPADLELERAG